MSNAITRASRAAFAALLAAFALASAGAQDATQAIEPAVYEKLSRAVFEVVVPKRATEDQFTYAEELPWDLLPYAERIDEYSSIGTAFCVGENRYLSAAHVFALEEESLNASFFIRDGAGAVYPVDQVYSYANFQDFILFSVKNPPASVPLERLPDPAINIRVFTVGNAFGQGIIIRDGVLTSRTSEERAGAWKWLRFSAAASPGNSGGPLVDSAGRVLGIAIARSENENYNLALPLEVVDAYPKNLAALNKKNPYSVPIFTYGVRLIEDTKVTLPLDIASLKDTLMAARAKETDKLLATLLSERKDALFPYAKGSEDLLRSSLTSYLPAIACEQTDYTWRQSSCAKTGTSTLADGSTFEYGEWSNYTLQRCKLGTGAMSAAEAMNDPERAMDAVLTGYSLSRGVGGKNVRITSLGKPNSIRTVTDRFGRIWQTAEWAIRFSDRTVIWHRLPTPDGYVAFFRIAPTWDRRALVNDLVMMCDYTDVDYTGTIAQWRALKAAGDIAPKAVRDIDISFDSRSRCVVTYSEASLTLSPSAFPVTDSTVLSSYVSFKVDGAKNLSEYHNCVELTNGGTESPVVSLGRIMKAIPSDSADRKNNWNLFTDRKGAFDGNAYTYNGSTYANKMIDLQSMMLDTTDPKEAPALYLLHFGTNAVLPLDKANKTFSALMAGVIMKPAAISEATGLPANRIDTARTPEKIGGRTIFDAISDNDEIAAKEFIARSLSISTRNADGQTPLLAALAQKREGIALSLVQAGCDIGGTNAKGRTTLLLALQSKYEQVALELVARKADVNVKDDTAFTPLMYALYYRLNDAASAIIDAGADIAPVNDHTWNALMYAISNGAKDIAKRLIEKGADVTVKDPKGVTALVTATQKGYADIARMLIERGSEVNTPVAGNWTPLMYAINHCDADTVGIMLDKGAEANVTCENGSTPLHMAVAVANPKMVRMLVERGADAGAKNKDGKTASDLAATLVNKTQREAVQEALAAAAKDER